MSIEALHLTKKYHKQVVVNDVTFSALRGKITGFLGPNGAGKSTTMKMAMGCVLPTGGSIKVDGMDVRDNPLQVKRNTGYLPESNPLYQDMYVIEFLKFIGNAYRLKKCRKKVAEMVEILGLTREKHKKIGALSKGFKQRVGLAQALIHNPSVLILDEPTTGLDPNQIVEIRKTIKNISEQKTVILSTHIMQEVEALCDHVVILNQGKVVANETVDTLKAIDSKIQHYLLQFETPIDTGLFEEYDCEYDEDKMTMKIKSEDEKLKHSLLKIIAHHNLPMVSIEKNTSKSIEDIFRKLTQQQGNQNPS